MRHMAREQDRFKSCLIFLKDTFSLLLEKWQNVNMYVFLISYNGLVNTYLQNVKDGRNMSVNIKSVNNNI